jgi:hypothetical protein
MYRLFVLLTILIFAASSAAAGTSAPKELKDLYFGEALYCAFQGDWFDAVARLDTELEQHYGLDEPRRDRLYYHINQAEFAVGDFELAYRMRCVTKPSSAWRGSTFRKTNRSMPSMPWSVPGELFRHKFTTI